MALTSTFSKFCHMVMVTFLRDFFSVDSFVI